MDDEVDAVARFRAQLDLLGCALLGAADWTAELCEGPVTTGADLTAAEIASWRRLRRDGRREPVSETWAIPGIVELRIRGGG
jgi:hypothetical protein